MKKCRIVSIILLLAVILCGCGQNNVSSEEPSGWDLAAEVNQKMGYREKMSTMGIPAVYAEIVDASHMEDPLPERIYKYFITVNLQTNTVTIYAKDSGGEYTVPYLNMLCSTGEATPTEGIYYLPGNTWPWLSLQGNVYGQYVTQIIDNILFHSVPYETLYDKASLETEEFNKLGTSASMGCVRLQVSDAKWVYDNAADIEAVRFFSDTDPGPLGWPTAPYISSAEDNGWDPTDPDPENPWNSNRE